MNRANKLVVIGILLLGRGMDMYADKNVSENFCKKNPEIKAVCERLAPNLKLSEVESLVLYRYFKEKQLTASMEELLLYFSDQGYNVSGIDTRMEVKSEIENDVFRITTSQFCNGKFSVVEREIKIE